MRHRVLFVDDEPRMLDVLQRMFKREYVVARAESAAEALDFIETTSNFSVIVSDQQMPGMDGITLLRRVRELSPDTVRVMLTGVSDLDTAVEAINEGAIFRFLNKPPDPDRIGRTVRDAVAQYELIRAEKELLEQTLRGSVSVLTGVLSLSDPESFSRSSRLRRYVRFMTRDLQMRSTWEVEIAAMLSQLGCVALNPELIRKSIHSATSLTPEERHQFTSHATTGEKLIGQIPRLEQVASMVRHQFDAPVPDQENFSEDQIPRAVIGGQLLRVALYYDQSRTGGEIHDNIIEDMLNEPDRFFEPFVRALSRYSDEDANLRTARLHLQDLRPGMILAEEVRTRRDLLIATKGQEISTIMLQRIKTFHRFHGVREPVLVSIQKGQGDAPAPQNG